MNQTERPDPTVVTGHRYANGGCSCENPYSDAILGQRSWLEGEYTEFREYVRIHSRQLHPASIEDQAARKALLDKSLSQADGNPCAICESRTSYANQWLSDDVMEVVILASGPSRLVTQDTHGLAHYDCVAHLIIGGDASQA